MSTHTLRGLAKAYSDSLIDRKQYIRERRLLIDDIVSGATEISPYESPPRVAQNEDHDRTFSDGETTLELPLLDVEGPTSTPTTPPPTGRNRIFVIVGALALCVIAVVALFKIVVPSAPLVTEPPGAGPTVDDVSMPNQAEELLLKFLDDNRWQNDRIDGLIAAWRNTPAATRRELDDGPSLRRATDVIYQKFLEEKALFDLGDQTEALATQRRLLDLAAALSLRHEGLARLEDEWRETQARLIAEEKEPIEQDTMLSSRATPSEVVVETIAALEAPTAHDADAQLPETQLNSATEPAGAAEAHRATGLPLVVEETEQARDVGTATVNETSPPAKTENLVSEPVVDSVPDPTPASAPETTPASTASVAADTSSPRAEAPDTAEPAPRQSGCRAALARQRRPYCRDMLGDGLKGPALAVLPAGQFDMGGRNTEERPRHTVTVQRAFALGLYEISAAEFQAFCTASKRECPPQPWSDPKLPMVNVSWTLASEYTQWLSDRTGAIYRLPSESEWEYATRAGTATVYPFGDEVLPTHARYSFRANETMPLANNDHSVNRNKFRLYHMIGNVREWVLDVWHDDYAGAPSDGNARTGSSDKRVARGGSFADGPDQIRSASRVPLTMITGDGKTGLRVVREVD